MPSLTTERLVLDPLSAADLPALCDLHAEADFWRYPLGRGQTRAETATFLDAVLARYEDPSRPALCAVRLRAGGTLIGWAGLSVPEFLPEILPAVEVGWRLGAGWWGQGYATEAGGAWVRWAFDEAGLERLVSIYEPANAASGRVMHKLGFRPERTTVHPARGVEVVVTELVRDTPAPPGP